MRVSDGGHHDPLHRPRVLNPHLPADKLHVWDVSDKENIREIAVLDVAGDHTMTGILGCEWAYGSDGSIVDLRDPSNPRLI